MLITPIKLTNFSCSRKNNAKPDYQTNITNTNCADSVSFSAKYPVLTVERELFHTKDIGIEDLPKFFDRLFDRKKPAAHRKRKAEAINALCDKVMAITNEEFAKPTALRKKEAEAIKALHDKVMAIVNEELERTGQKKGELKFVNKDARLNIREANYNIDSKTLFIYGGRFYDPVDFMFRDGKIIQIVNTEKVIDLKASKDKIQMTDRRDNAW